MTNSADDPTFATGGRTLLPNLALVAQMTTEDKRRALASWIAWFNTYRDRVSPELEHELDEVLLALDRDRVDRKRAADLQTRFDTWLTTAGRVGVGHGPGEDDQEAP
jgi:hypothetical protein